MNHEAESSTAARHNAENPTPDEEPDLLTVGIDEEQEAKDREQRAKERRLDAKRKRIALLDNLLRELDSLVFVELVTVYYLDCSFFWFLVRSIFHAMTLTPLPDLQLHHQNDEHKPFLPLVLCSFAANFLLHAICRAPSANEENRGYLHGGLMIDFIGQEGPTSKWKLLALDVCILLLQLVMVSVTVKKRELKKKLANISAGTPTATSAAGADAPNTDGTTAPPTTGRDQDADSEERGVLRRTDTLSDTGADADHEADEEDALLSTSTSESAPADALELLSSGQCVVGNFTIIDTLLKEHADYQVYRRTRPEAGASSGLSPDTLRQLHQIRATFGVGGG